MKNEEYQIQKMVIQWFRLKYPDKLLNADVGGVWTRNYAQAIKNKCMGHSNGFPDLFIPEPNSKYHGLFIELKSEKGHATPEQKEWIKNLNQRGYLAQVLYGFDETREYIDGYLHDIKER